MSNFCIFQHNEFSDSVYDIRFNCKMNFELKFRILLLCSRRNMVVEKVADSLNRTLLFQTFLSFK